jgi:hypothetical protein
MSVLLQEIGPDWFVRWFAAETERVVIEDVVASPSTEVVTEEEIDETTGSLGLSPQPSPSFQVGKNKGIKKIFGRWDNFLLIFSSDWLILTTSITGPS